MTGLRRPFTRAEKVPAMGLPLHQGDKRRRWAPSGRRTGSAAGLVGLKFRYCHSLNWRSFPPTLLRKFPPTPNPPPSINITHHRPSQTNIPHIQAVVEQTMARPKKAEKEAKEPEVAQISRDDFIRTRDSVSCSIFL